MLASADACIETARCPLSKINLEANREESTEIKSKYQQGRNISDGIRYCQAKSDNSEGQNLN
jgi:hypothetical protein